LFGEVLDINIKIAVFKVMRLLNEKKSKLSAVNSPKIKPGALGYILSVFYRFRPSKKTGKNL